MIEAIAAALAPLRAGRLVVIPTDTVYGVAALPTIPSAIEAIFAAKGRPEDKPLPILVASLADADEVGVLDDRARMMASRHWPGPLTLVVPRSPRFTADLGGGTDQTVAVRIPRHELARGLLRESGPLAVTSANRSGKPDATTVEEARAALAAAVDVYLDGGECQSQPSTIVSLVGETTVLREGAIRAREVLEPGR